jgi:Putative zinc-finger
MPAWCRSTCDLLNARVGGGVLACEEDAVVERAPVPADDCCAVGGPDVAGWVLGALDPGDAERFAQHLSSCRACQLTVAELEPAGQVLLATSPVGPPPRLAAATLARVRRAAAQARRSPRSAGEW